MFQTLAEGWHYPNLFSTSRCGASDCSSEIQQVRHERDPSNVHRDNLETRKHARKSAVRSLEGQVLRLRRMIGVARLKSKTLQVELERKMKMGIFFSPHSMRDTRDTSLKS